MKITIVVPTYNEALNLPVLIEDLMDLEIPGLNLLVVDDNSPDGCGKIAENYHTDYPNFVNVLHRERKEGLGKAYVQGLCWALENGADVIGMMDADLSHPVKALPEMLASLQKADIVIGSRYVEGGSVDKNWPLWRKFLSAFGNYYARSILNLPIKDATGGYRIWSRSALESIPLRETQSSGYVFIVELAYLAALRNLRFVEVPIYFAERIHGNSKMSLKIQIEAAIKIWRLRNKYNKMKLKNLQNKAA